MAVRRASSRLEVRLTPADKANLRQLAAAHRLPLGAYLVQCGLGQLRPGVDQVRELTLSLEALERRLERVEQRAGVS